MIPEANEVRLVTIRSVKGTGKAHRGVLYISGPYKGSINPTCSCPNTRNGHMRFRVICEGIEKANCNG